MAQLVTEQSGVVQPSDRLMELLALDEAEAFELLLALLLSEEPPLWLEGAGRNGQLRLEAIPEEATRTLDEVCASHSVEGKDGVTLFVMANPKKAGTG